MVNSIMILIIGGSNEERYGILENIFRHRISIPVLALSYLVLVFIKINLICNYSFQLNSWVLVVLFLSHIYYLLMINSLGPSSCFNYCILICGHLLSYLVKVTSIFYRLLMIFLDSFGYFL